MKINIYKDPEALSIAAANLFVEQAQSAVIINDRFSVALSGGNTPARTFELLAQKPWCDQVPWDKTFIFWGDERCVPKDDIRHNALMAHKLLLSHVPIPTHHIHPIICDDSPKITAEKYELILHEFFKDQDVCFDFVFLGIGNDGHTASLFPDTPVLHERTKWVCEVSVPKQEFNRITLTIPLLERSLLTVFLVEGAEKATVLKTIIEGPWDISTYPAQLIAPLNGALIWMVDEAASQSLNKDKLKLQSPDVLR
jgi:6-phosphogluconolactonase